MGVQFYAWPRGPNNVVVEDGCGSSWEGQEYHGTCPKPHTKNRRADQCVLMILEMAESESECAFLTQNSDWDFGA